MNWLCILLGHKHTACKFSHSGIYADDLFCARCKMWSYDYPYEWFEKWGNGFLPDFLGWCRVNVYFPLAYIVRRVEIFIHGDDGPF